MKEHVIAFYESISHRSRITDGDTPTSLVKKGGGMQILNNHLSGTSMHGLFEGNAVHGHPR
jgi:hypothetical protein